MSGDGVAGEFSPKLGLYVMYVIGNLMKGFSIETKKQRLLQASYECSF